MKRLSYLLIALLCTLFMSCGSDNKGIDEPDEPVNPKDVTLEISTTDLTFEAEGGEKEFTITCNTDWTITNESTWCKTDVTSGNGNKTVTVTADSYNETEERNTNLTVKAGGKTSILTVTQKQANAIILSKNKFDLPQEGGDISIEIKSNIEYEIIIPDAYQTWIQQNPETRAMETKKFDFNILPNETPDKREGCIIFHGNSLKDTVFIYQVPQNQLVLTQNTCTVSPEGGEFTVELKTNIDYYDVLIPDDAASWVKLITTRALRTDRLTFRIEANTGNTDRSVKIAVKDKNSPLSDTITILQPIEQADIVWETEQDLIDFKAAGHTRIQGNITVQGSEIKTLQKLDNLLTEIDGTLTLNCSTLTSLDGLYGLTKITGDIIVNVWGMTSFEGLENLTTIEGNFKVLAQSNLNPLKSFEGLSSLKSIGGDFEVNTSSSRGDYSLPTLESFEGLENLQTIGGNFKVIAVSSYSYMSSSHSLPALKSFKGLSSLKSIGGDFEVNAFSFASLISLESFEGLGNLQNIGGNFKVIATTSSHNNDYSLPALESFKGLSSLKSIGGDFEVNAFSFASLISLESFEGLGNLQNIGGNFKVIATTSSHNNDYSLPALESFKGLSSLKSIGGDFEVNASSYYYSSLNALESFEGLENLQTIGGNFKVIASSSSFSSSLDALKSFKGLSSLQAIGGDFEVNASYSSLTALESFEGLENLQTIEGKKLTVKECHKLNNINALDKIEALDEISITDCPALYDFCILKNVVQNMSGTFYVNGNGYNPTKYQLLNGACSQTPPDNTDDNNN